MKISLRPIKTEDFEFLWKLHNAALKNYVEQTWGWDETFQRKTFEADFDPKNGEIIVFDGNDIGFWWTIEKENEILLASIRLLPEFQNRKIGTRLIQELIRDSEKSIRLQVLKINPARNLYEKLGFKIEGETGTHFLMRTGNGAFFMSITKSDRIKGGIVGLLVGDALGVPYEFHARESIPPFDEIEFEPPANFQRAHAGVPAGTWSDDGAQALCLLDSLLECGKFNADDFANRIVRWYREDYLAVDEVFDVGVQTQRAILNLRKGFPPLTAGPADETKNGNGSLMRVLPLALWHQGTDLELIADAFDQSSVTHGHLRSKRCCALYCLWARRVLQDVENAWENALVALYEIFPEGTPENMEFETKIFPKDAIYDIKGGGYVVESLRAAHWACQKTTYEETVKAAISLGDDTDTTACIAGGIAGLKFGVEAIPKRWRDDLRGREIYEPLVEKLLEKVA